MHKDKFKVGYSKKYETNFNKIKWNNNIINEDKKICSDNINKLNENEIFVFGSNEEGRHGKGAAKIACQKFNAKYGLGFGESGQTFAIPTIKKLRPYTKNSIDEIKEYVEKFIIHTQKPENINKKYLVTQIGCGLAGFKIKQIAPLFKDTINIKNIYLPEVFYNHLNK